MSIAGELLAFVERHLAWNFCVLAMWCVTAVVCVVAFVRGGRS